MKLFIWGLPGISNPPSILAVAEDIDRARKLILMEAESDYNYKDGYARKELEKALQEDPLQEKEAPCVELHP